MQIIERSFPLDDIAIRADGTGRTVVAYCAEFDREYEVRDYEGHYFERLHARSFDQAMKNDTPAVCLFNHGMMTGTMSPSDRFGMPLGTPEEIRADGRGLLTVTRYANTPLADEVLELINAGAIRSQSFRGPIHASRAAGSRDGVRVIERMRLGIRDYGPTAFAVNPGAEIVGVRSQTVLLDQIADLSDEERGELFAHFSGASAGPVTPDAPVEPTSGTDAPPEPVVATPPVGPSLETLQLSQDQRHRRT